MLPLLSKISNRPWDRDISCALCAGTSLRTHLISSCPRCSTHEHVACQAHLFFCNPCPDLEPAAGRRRPSAPGRSMELSLTEKTHLLTSHGQRGEPHNPNSSRGRRLSYGSKAVPLSSLSIKLVKDLTSPETAH